MKPECKIRMCDCHYENTSTCRNCSRNKNAENGELEDSYLSIIDNINILYNFLAIGEMPEGVQIKNPPKLGYKKAFSVIWFLQEVTHHLPAHIEQCDGCDDLFDSDCEGFILDDQYDLNGKTLPKKYWGHYCDGCAPNVEFELA